MYKEKVNIKKVVNYWTEGAKQNFDTAKFLFKGKRYSDCLFFCHLTIEKTLKAIVVKKTKTHAPYIHQLVDLARIAEIKLTPQQIEDLTEITEFNIAARYTSYKLDFYKKCTKSYTEKYFITSKNLYLWLKKQI